MENSPFVLQKEKGAYVWQDMARQCRKYGLQWRQPGTFPRLGVVPLPVALLGVEQDWIGAFCRRVMELNFVLDQDINRSDLLAPILTELGLPASDILDQAQAEPTKTRLRNKQKRRVPKESLELPPSLWGRRCFGAMIAWTMLFCGRAKVPTACTIHGPEVEEAGFIETESARKERGPTTKYSQRYLKF